MKKILYYTLGVATLMSVASCSDFLETSSPSVVDADFVFSNTTTARAALDGAYESWRDIAQNGVFGDGIFYGADICGSDIERHPEAFTNQLGRHWPESFYQNGTYASQYGLLTYLKEDGIYAGLFEVVSKANAVITSMRNAPNFSEIINGGQTEMGQMYGEAIALRATAYRELCRNFGDVPYVGTYGVIPAGLVGRDSIYDACIADLVNVVELMYPVGSIPGFTTKNYFSKTYVQGLIGRMCLEAGGYQTRRGDLTRVDSTGTAYTYEYKGTENNGAKYGRRSDWKSLYQIAQKYYAELLTNTGTAKFYTTDPRGASDNNGRTFGNPYQYFFEQMHQADDQYADESIYEYPMQQGGGNDGRPYSFGRPSNGGSKAAYPCKNYGQGRINPAFYYGMFDPNDMRRDVSVAVTGSTGKGVEKLVSFEPGSKVDGGGLSLNKWDENRQTSPWVAAQRKSGINGPYMRMAEIYLGYAEVCAALGDEVTAKQYLKTVRERSFPEGKANTDEFINSWGGDLVRAVIEERGFEYAGEGDRRWTLIRSGYVGEDIMAVKNLTTKMLDGLTTDGYYKFDNGNIIPAYVWTKLVDAKSEHGHRLTAQCPDDKKDDPVLYPGWRGQNDSWENFGLDYGTSTPKTNLAIKGLFEICLPTSITVTRTCVLADGEEKAKTETETITEGITMKSLYDLLNGYDTKKYTAVSIKDADGYDLVKWGVDLVYGKTGVNRQEYEKYLFYDYDGQKAPIYLWPFTPNVLSSGGFTNGYGFKNE